METTSNSTYPSTTEFITSTTTNNNSTRVKRSGNIDVVCHESEDGYAVFVPHPYDCSLYYECVDLTPVLMSCPAGLYFDSRINVCNWPEYADCHVKTTTTTTTASPTTTETTTNSTTTATDSPTTTETSTTSTTATASPTTTETSINSTTITASPTTTGTSTNSTTTTASPTTTGTSTTSTTTTTTSSRVKRSANFDVVCHESEDGYAVFVPHPYDCSLFYECRGRTPVLMSCPAGLYFDSRINVCNWP